MTKVFDQRFRVFELAVTLIGLAIALQFIPSSKAMCEEKPILPPAPDRISLLEKRLGEVERQVSALSKELKELHNELLLHGNNALLPAGSIDAIQAVEIIKAACDVAHVNVTIEAVKALNSIAMRVDSRNLDDIRKVLRHLDETAFSGISPPRRGPIRRLTKEEEIVEGLYAIEILTKTKGK